MEFVHPRQFAEHQFTRSDIMSRQKDWKDIKTGTRKVRSVCNRLTPLKRGVACIAKLNKFESDINRIIKKRRT